MEFHSSLSGWRWRTKPPKESWSGFQLSSNCVPTGNGQNKVGYIKKSESFYSQSFPILSHNSNIIACWQHFYLNTKSGAVWPDWSIYCTLGDFSKPVEIIILPKMSIFKGNFLLRCPNLSFFQCNHLWATFSDIWRLLMVTLSLWPNQRIQFVVKINHWL